MNLLSNISEVLDGVLSGRVSYTSLQTLVDTAVIDDELPDDLSPSVRACLYELQTALELIDEHQSTHSGLSTQYSGEQIAKLLSGFADGLTESSL